MHVCTEKCVSCSHEGNPEIPKCFTAALEYAASAAIHISRTLYEESEVWGVPGYLCKACVTQAAIKTLNRKWEDAINEIEKLKDLSNAYRLSSSNFNLPSLSPEEMLDVVNHHQKQLEFAIEIYKKKASRISIKADLIARTKEKIRENAEEVKKAEIKRERKTPFWKAVNGMKKTGISEAKAIEMVKAMGVSET